MKHEMYSPSTASDVFKHKVLFISPLSPPTFSTASFYSSSSLGPAVSAYCQALFVGGMAGLGAAATGGVTTSLFSSSIEGGRHGHSSFSRFCSATRKVLCSATLVFDAALTRAYEVARGRWWTCGRAGQEMEKGRQTTCFTQRIYAMSVHKNVCVSV